MLSREELSTVTDEENLTYTKNKISSVFPWIIFLNNTNILITNIIYISINFQTSSCTLLSKNRSSRHVLFLPMVWQELILSWLWFVSIHCIWPELTWWVPQFSPGVIYTIIQFFVWFCLILEMYIYLLIWYFLHVAYQRPLSYTLLTTIANGISRMAMMGNGINRPTDIPLEMLLNEKSHPMKAYWQWWPTHDRPMTLVVK